jgi:hypothetical protein
LQFEFKKLYTLNKRGIKRIKMIKKYLIIQWLAVIFLGCNSLNAYTATINNATQGKVRVVAKFSACKEEEIFLNPGATGHIYSDIFVSCCFTELKFFGLDGPVAGIVSSYTPASTGFSPGACRDIDISLARSSDGKAIIVQEKSWMGGKYFW